ncbi:MAG: sigma-70 family RNA polymerase sigma factor [Mobilitalea sp.]
MDFYYNTDDDLEKIINKYSKMLLRIAYTYMKNTYDSEEIVQEVYIRLMTKKPRFASGEHEKAWLIKVTINISINYLKATYRKHVTLDDNISYFTEKESELLSVVLCLPDKYKIIIHLFYYEGYSIKEIAKILNIPSSTVGTRLERGRNTLKKVLKGEF